MNEALKTKHATARDSIPCSSAPLVAGKMTQLVKSLLNKDEDLWLSLGSCVEKLGEAAVPVISALRRQRQDDLHD